jgi:hypothetical protein
VAYGPVYYAGSASGVTVTFANVTVPATGAGAPTTLTFRVANIRVNAATGGSPQVTESLIINYTSGGAPATFAGTVQNVGYIQTSLAVTTLGPGTPASTTASYASCAGNVIANPVSTANLSFTVNVKQLVANAFKTLAGEDGSYVAAATPGLAASTGLATQATEISIALGNIPASATVYVPINITPTGGSTLTLVGSPVAVTAPAGIVALATTGNGGYAMLTPSNNTVTILYGVTNEVNVAVTFSVPVYVAFAANSANPQGAMTVLTSYAPAATLATGALPTQIPTFAVSTGTPVSATTIISCATTLLFPYVTNATGFETGLAIANTTTDNIPTASGKTFTSNPVNGSCSINFYGSQATQPPAATTGTLGVYTAAPLVMPVYTSTLTAASGATNFTGYAIAYCNFLEAHGFAFITDLTGQFSGAMGYLAVVLPNGRNEAPTTTLTNQ